jgi:hypothetical protein
MGQGLGHVVPRRAAEMINGETFGTRTYQHLKSTSQQWCVIVLLQRDVYLWNISLLAVKVLCDLFMRAGRA